MQWAALIAWIATAFGGIVLLTHWVRHGGFEQTEGIQTARLFSHLTTAVGGLVLWIIYIVADESAFAWAAVALLVVVALIGASMFVISSRGRTNTTRTSSPAEGTFPLPVVMLHGLLGTTTLILAVLAATGIAS